jgi:hypothetical protein
MAPHVVQGAFNECVSSYINTINCFIRSTIMANKFNINLFPNVLHMVNELMYDNAGVQHRKIKSLMLPAKFLKRVQVAEQAAASLKGKKVRDFIKKLPEGIPASELKADARNYFATGDHDSITAMAKAVKGGKQLQAVIEDAFEGELADIIYITRRAH